MVFSNKTNVQHQIDKIEKNPSNGEDLSVVFREPVDKLKTVDLLYFQGVDVDKANKLDRLNIHNAYDFVMNLPFRYEDHTYLRTLDTTQSYEETPPCNFLLTITSAPNIKARLTEYNIVDHKGNGGKIVFFHVPAFLLKKLLPDSKILVYGSVKLNAFTHIPTLSHPELIFVDEERFELPEQVSPIYHLTSGIKQNTMRKFVNQALKLLCSYPFEEILPPEFNSYGLDLNEALLITHNPPARKDHGHMYLEALPSFQRICYEELIAYKLTILELKSKQNSKNAPAIEYKEQIHQQFLQSLAFEPTSAQNRVFHEVLNDCMKNCPMNRLVHGDVGSGKTLVASMVMLQFQANQLQSAMLAPTDLLAKQHHRKLSDLFKPLNINVALVTGTLKKKERELVFEQIRTGKVQIIVGTHALFQKDICYKNLSLVIIDEQHRFGVAQREALLKKATHNCTAHELLMTATPIPRSMQFALFSDTDVSTIDVMPKGRSPIITALISQDRYDEVVGRLYEHCGIRGNQAYWVCPLIEENEISDASSVKERYKSLCEKLPDISIGLLHAQMSEKSKNETMEQFVNGNIKILVATTIVEVGVDVPNATVIVIESSEKLGLAQLHQLRGRVGRGNKESFCLLMYKAQNKNDQFNEVGLKRLEIMRNSNNGFEIANQDLVMRGAGEFFGTNQAGKENFRFADLNRDYDLIKKAQLVATRIYEQYPENAQLLIQRWFPDAYQNLHNQDQPEQEEIDLAENEVTEQDNAKPKAKKKVKSKSKAKQLEPASEQEFIEFNLALELAKSKSKSSKNEVESSQKSSENIKTKSESFTNDLEST